MGILRTLFYPVIAPVLRKWLRGSITGKKIEGSSMKLYYERSQHLGFFLMRNIRYEKQIRDALMSHVHSEQLVFEIGANIGQYSLLLSERIGDKGRLVCVEPDPENLAFLYFNIRKNRCNNVDICPWAIANQAGKMKFYADAVTGGRSGTLLSQYAAFNPSQTVHEVEVKTYRELIRLYGVPDIVKVDVEGAEDLIFTDGSILHDKTTYLVEVRKETKEKIYSTFAESGFSIYVVDQGITKIDNPGEIPGFSNLLMYKEVTL